MAPHSSILAWNIPWMEEPGRLQSMGSLRVGHNWVTSLSLSCIGEGNGNPLQCSCLENPRDGRAWWAAVYGVAQSRTRLKRPSSSSSILSSQLITASVSCLTPSTSYLRTILKSMQLNRTADSTCSLKDVPPQVFLIPRTTHVMIGFCPCLSSIPHPLN